ncbi:MAG: gliding motility protein RemB [Bacteroidetes bacterium HGW-Bacteroidetes-2]|jgi:hypothetical protein|nr:MAG: gliding motility protein RemB [Bacteroidetes bacterium HGW-Bacteroidetes-2]
MKKSFLFLLAHLITISLFGQQQVSEFEKYPVFPSCENENIENLKNCFNNALQAFIFENFKLPKIVNEENYKGELAVFFEVDKEGRFNLLYTEAIYLELKEEIERVFELLPQIKPATYNSRPTFVQFTMPIKIPLQQPIFENNENQKLQASKKLNSKQLEEYEAIENLGYTNEKYTSQINIPLSHQEYARFDFYMNQIGTNAHTAQKPYLYQTVNTYQNLEERDTQLFNNKSTWLGRKFWNEHLLAFKGDNYWFTIDPGVDLQVGKDFDSQKNSTYNNTRLAVIQGGLGKKLNFHAVLYESQGRFADYFNRYAESIAADGGGNPAIIPGMGIAKAFKSDSYDYPVATGYLSYSPNDMFNIQFGNGKNFIGDGYRSLLLSDVASPYPYLKISTTFWKIKYTNTWMSLRDVRQEATIDGAFATKYMATHYLSYNISKRLNIGLFESVLWDNSNNRGVDINYLNPIIFYRAIEFSTGPRSGNALIGLSGKYKFSNHINTYGQMIIDEFSSGDIFGGEKSWKNKVGFQIGAKYHEPFRIKNLYLQAEYNRVRPYTYSHNTIILNYGHNNQSMAHLWGANFSEFIAIARYEKGRVFGSAKLIFGERGFDFNDGTDNFNYGGNIFRDERDRPFDFGNEIAQGNKTTVFHGEFQAGYLINPSTNLKVYASLIYRDFNPQVNTASEFKNNTTWLNFGIRTDLFNWYYDF